MTREEITDLLKTIEHPEQGRDIVTMGMVHRVDVSPDGRITVDLHLTKPRDPMGSSIRRAVEGIVRQVTGEVPAVYVTEPHIGSGAKHTSGSTAKGHAPSGQSGKDEGQKIATHVIAIASGKGGVGKSTVTANLAVALAAAGHRVGLLDADIYGPSMPKMFGLEGYTPLPASVREGDTPGGDPELELIAPAESHGVRVMSIGFFIGPSDALAWRGPMATGALRQLLHQTAWGPLDYLLIDLPPGTGDLHLTLISEIKLDGAIIVTTPQAVALQDVERGIALFRNENVQVPILGVVENMAWFTPAELPDNKYYIFGRSDAIDALAARENIPLLGRIPLVQSIAEGGDAGTPVTLADSASAQAFRSIAARL